MSLGNYHTYKDRAHYFNGVAPTVDGLSGAIFQKAPTVTVPDRIAPYMPDITLANESLEQFALRTVREILTTGRIFLLANMSDGDPARPYVRLYAAEDAISWRTAAVDGAEVLTRVILREHAATPDPKDEFVDVVSEQYRALELVDGAYQCRVFTKAPASHLADREQWIPSVPIIPLRRGVPLSFIPGVFINASSLTPEIKRSPMLDLSDVNRSHYMSSAELENLLWYVGSPTPWASSFQGGGDGKKTLRIGSATAWILGDNGRAGLLEMTGQGAAAIRENMAEKRRQMVALGAKLLEDSPRSAETATSVSQRNAASQANLKTITQTAEAGLSMGLQWLGWWTGPEAKPSDVPAAIELSKDFYALRMSADELKSLVTSWQSDGISFDTLHYNLQRGDLMRPGVSADDERAAIARQAEPRTAGTGA